MRYLDIEHLHIRDFIHGSDVCHIGGGYFSGPLTGLHSHDFYEVFWVEKGSGGHQLNGKPDALSAGDVRWITPQDRHGFYGDQRHPLHIINIAFPGAAAERLLETAAGFSSSGRPFSLEPFRLQNRERVAMRRELEELMQHMDNPWMFIRFLAALASYQPAIRRQPSWDEAHVPGWLLNVLHRMEDPDVLFEGLPAMVRLAGRSHEHLARVCRQTLQQRPGDILSAARMQYAARMLRISDKKIIEISMDCGLNSLSRFHALFKKHYGCTPNEYRRQQAGLLKPFF